MNIVASDYRAPWWAKSPHLQTALASSPLRVKRGERALHELGATSEEHVLDAGDGVRLHGVHTHLPGQEPRGLALLLHGWEGSAESGYMRLTAARLLEAGFEVFRLNFRDHGPSHHLNEEVFHSCRMDEVVGAAKQVADRWPTRPVVAAGYSLGGNFALRLAMAAPAAGLPLARVAAVCPALDPERTTQAMEQGFPLYQTYFRRKWARSLRRKRELFPDRHDFEDAGFKRDLRGMTAWMIDKGGYDFPSVEDYFDGYRISRERLAGLQVPADILTAADDPVIPVEDFHALQLPDIARVEIATHGGHCAFLQDARLHGYAEGWVSARLSTALEHLPG